MNTQKLAELVSKKSANVVYHNFENASACIDDCRGLIRGILELASEEERREILRSLVKYDYREEIEKMMG